MIHESLATDDDWAHYEETLAGNAERDRGPDSLAYANRIRQRRALPGGTDTLGFGLFALRRPDPGRAVRSRKVSDHVRRREAIRRLALLPRPP